MEGLSIVASWRFLQGILPKGSLIFNKSVLEFTIQNTIGVLFFISQIPVEINLAF